MAVPNTTTFTFNDVCDAVYGNHTAPKDLVAAFAAANAALFDPAYVGAKTNLLNFRNYGAATQTLTLSISTWTFARGGGTKVVTVTASAANPWNAGSGSYGAWLHVSPTTGTGSGSFTITCDAAGAGRTGSIAVVSMAPTVQISITQS